jgi:hypothetical protein
MTNAYRKPKRTRLLDIAGCYFGRWRVISKAHVQKSKVMWLCECECGTLRMVAGSNLHSGKSVSCGCAVPWLVAESWEDRRRKLGQRRDLSTSLRMSLRATYNSWIAMRQRCENPNHAKWPRYGGRGIKVCERWRVFENFAGDMGARPEGCTLDRIDNDGHYEPGNCRWLDSAGQGLNRKQAHAVILDGVRMSTASACRNAGIAHGIVSRRLHQGWTLQRALFTPPQRRKSR